VGTKCRGPRGACPDDPAQEALLQVVVVVVVHERHPVESLQHLPLGVGAAEVPVDERGRGHRPVAVDAERDRRAALYGLGLRRDRRHHRAGPQELGGAVLVLAVQVEDHLGVTADDRQGVEEPRAERVGVHRERDRRDAVIVVRRCSAEVARSLLVEQADLSGMPQHDGAVGRRHDRRRPQQQDPADELLHRLDPLRDRRRGDRQRAGSGVERAEVDGRQEGLEVFTLEAEHEPILRCDRSVSWAVRR
jgi:hypothetical protein